MPACGRTPTISIASRLHDSARFVALRAAPTQHQQPASCLFLFLSRDDLLPHGPCSTTQKSCPSMFRRSITLGSPPPPTCFLLCLSHICSSLAASYKRKRTPFPPPAGPWTHLLAANAEGPAEVARTFPPPLLCAWPSCPSLVKSYLSAWSLQTIDTRARDVTDAGLELILIGWIGSRVGRGLFRVPLALPPPPPLFCLWLVKVTSTGPRQSLMPA